MNEYFEDEATVFSTYLGGKPGSEALIEHYNSGVKSLDLQLTTKEKGTLKKVIKYPFLLPFTDAGLALLSPANSIRKRLLLMSALIETDKNYTHLFITERDASFALLRFFYTGTIAVMKACIGAALILMLRWK